MSVLLVLVIFFALAFDYINGFHDTANAIATVVSTRVLTPLMAILMAAVLNFAGAMIATNVAKTIAGGIVSNQIEGAPMFATQTVVLAAIIGAIVWNLITWRFGIPSSSSHALIGGLVGAALTRGFYIASQLSHGAFSIVDWAGVVDKVLLPLIGSPIAGFLIGYAIMRVITYFFAHWHPKGVGTAFKRLQVASSALMAFSHGMNDAQKSMGIITLALISSSFLPTPGSAHILPIGIAGFVPGMGGAVDLSPFGEMFTISATIPTWVMLSCATMMGLGTSAGGWRIIKTMGHRIIRLEPVNGFAAETSGAAVIMTASHFGMPVSTTHVIAGSIFGVGAAKRFSAVRWQVAINMVMAWFITIPASALFAAIFYVLLALIQP